MNGYVIAILAWIGLSPVFGVALGTALRHADGHRHDGHRHDGHRHDGHRHDGHRRSPGDPWLNHGRPHALPVMIANQVVPFKRATSRVPS